jgi:hypothetical protein
MINFTRAVIGITSIIVGTAAVVGAKRYRDRRSVLAFIAQHEGAIERLEGIVSKLEGDIKRAQRNLRKAKTPKTRAKWEKVSLGLASKVVDVQAMMADIADKAESLQGGLEEAPAS